MQYFFMYKKNSLWNLLSETNKFCFRGDRVPIAREWQGPGCAPSARAGEGRGKGMGEGRREGRW